MPLIKSPEQRCANFFLKKVEKALKQIANGRRHGYIYNSSSGIYGWRGVVQIISTQDDVFVQLVGYDSWVPLHKVYQALVGEGCSFDKPQGKYNTPVDYAAGRDDMFILNIYPPNARR